MAEICQEYVFTEIVIAKKFLFLRKIAIVFFPKTCKFSENLLENRAMCLLLVTAKKTWGHRAYFFRKAKNIPKNEEKRKNHLQEKLNLCPLNTLKFQNYNKCPFYRHPDFIMCNLPAYRMGKT